MPTATVKVGGRVQGRCVNCGDLGGREVVAVGPEGVVGWRGCEHCWPRECNLRMDVVRRMMRDAHAQAKKPLAAKG